MYLRKFSFIFFVSLALHAIAITYYADANQGDEIKQIQLTKDPYKILIGFNKKPEYKVVLVDPKEIMIAFKNVTVSKNIRKSGPGMTMVKKMIFENKQRDVISLLINTQAEITEIEPQWINKNNTLSVLLKTKIAPNPPDKAGQKKTPDPAASQKEIAPPKTENAKTKPESLTPKIDPISLEKTSQVPPPDSAVLPPKTEPLKHEETISQMGSAIKDEGPAAVPKSKINGAKTGFSESSDDLIPVLKDESCIKETPLKEAYNSCQSTDWQNAFSVLNQFIGSGVSNPCLETAYYLRGYSFYKMNEKKGVKQNLESVQFLQDSLSYYPESKYIPFCMAALGKSYMEMGNYTEARGYFKIIQDRYKDYTGLPEVLLELGKLYVKIKEYRDAINTFKKIASDYPDSLYVTKMKIEQGKALYEINNFREALRVLNEVVESNPKLIYESAELLLNIGNCYYYIGKYKEARETLSKVYNYFPDHKSNDTVLARIGDAYLDEKLTEDAKKIFKLVVEKYPGSDGLVISSMRMAPYLETAEEKKEVYERIVREFGNHPMANLAMLRLAVIENEMGQYEESLTIIRTLFTKQSRSLRKEAMYTMEASYTGLFEKLLAENNYPAVLTLYERDKLAISRLESPEVSFLIGKAFLRGYLYDQSIQLFNTANKHFDREKRPPELLFCLGVSLQETGQADKALELLSSYARLQPKGEKVAEAFHRKGKIMLIKGQYADAIAEFDNASASSATDEEKAKVMIDKASALTNTKEYTAAVQLLVSAINTLSSSPGNYFDMISLAYKDLSEAYSQSQSYVKAADAYAMSIEFAKKDSEIEYPFLQFRLGELYRQGNIREKAETAYNQVIASGDLFWGKIAEEKLREMQLDERLKKTT